MGGDDDGARRRRAEGDGDDGLGEAVDGKRDDGGIAAERLGNGRARRKVCHVDDGRRVLRVHRWVTAPPREENGEQEYGGFQRAVYLAPGLALGTTGGSGCQGESPRGRSITWIERVRGSTCMEKQSGSLLAKRADP